MKSLLQMVHELQRRVDALEKRPAENAETTFYRERVLTLEAELRNAAPQADTSAGSGASSAQPAVAAPNRKMCPKCGVKPNHFFHVKWCGKQKEEKQDAAIRSRDQGKT